MKKTILTVFTTCLMAGGALADTLSIGTLPAADSIVLHVAADEGLFRQEGLDVEIVPFRSALEIGAAMRAGKLSGHFGDLMNVISQNASGVPQSVILTTTYTHPAQRAFGLAVSPAASERIRSLSDLDGAQSAMSSSTIIHYLLDRMTETEQLPASALQTVEVKQIPVRLQMLMSGQCETAVLPEPLISVVEAKGGRVIWDDSGLDEALAVVALKKECLDDETVVGFRRAVAAAAARIEEDPDKYRAVMIQKRLLPGVVAEGYKMVRFSMFGTADGLPPLPDEADVSRVSHWMMSAGILKEEPAYTDIVRNP